MITTFNTSKKGSGSGSMNKIIMVIIIGAGVYFGYKYIIKPAMDKRNKDDE